MSNKLGRFAAAILAVLAAAFIAGCGGGGGGGSPAPVTPVTPTPVVDTTGPMLRIMTSSPAALTTTIVVDADEALLATSKLTVKKPDGIAIAGGTVLGADQKTLTWTSTSGPLTCATTYRVESEVYDLAKNKNDSVWFEVTTVACPLTYSQLVFGNWTNGRLFGVDLTTNTCTAVPNQTSYQTGAIPLSSFTAYDGNPLADGSLLFQATAASDGLRKNVYVPDPRTPVVKDYTATLPAGATFSAAAESNSAQPVANTTSARVTNAWIYADPAARWNLLSQPDGGGAPTTVCAGSFAGTGTWGWVRAYSKQ